MKTKKFLQKCKIHRAANVHNAHLDIVPKIEYNIVRFRRKGVLRVRYLSTFEVAEKWGISPRRVGVFCSQNRIPGAQQAGSRWIIPEDAEKPADARIKSGKISCFERCRDVFGVKNKRGDVFAAIVFRDFFLR